VNSGAALTGKVPPAKDMAEPKNSAAIDRASPRSRSAATRKAEIAAVEQSQTNWASKRTARLPSMRQPRAPAR
jgi:hypothetical protein